MDQLEIPSWADNASTWKAIHERIAAGPPPATEGFLHRDYHPGNMLWQNGHISGIVDWVNGCTGPLEVDVSHCRKNLAILHGIESAETFDRRYRHLTGAPIPDAYWDACAIADYDPDLNGYMAFRSFGVPITAHQITSRINAFATQVAHRIRRTTRPLTLQSMTRTFITLFITALCMAAQPAYDLVLKAGHVIDAKNRISQVMDVGITSGKIARIAPDIPETQGRKVIDVRGLYVTPGLIDLHAHLYNRPGNPPPKRNQSVQPDAFSFRTGVTTMVDPGTSGWRDFANFREITIQRSQTRVLAWLNIVAAGMGHGNEDDPAADGRGRGRQGRQRQS